MNNTITLNTKTTSIKQLFTQSVASLAITKISTKLCLLTLATLLSINVNAQNCTVNANIDVIICANQTMTLQGNSAGLVSAAGTKWVQVAGPTVVIDNPTALITTVSSFGAGVYTFRLTAKCTDGNTIGDNVVITVKPITNALVLSGNQSSCPGVLSVSANTPASGETGAWSGSGFTFASSSAPSTTVTLPTNSAGAVPVTWTITNANGCSSTSPAVTITNYGGLSPVTAGADQTLGNCYTATQSTSLSGSFGGVGLGNQMGAWLQVSGPNYATVANVNDNNTGVSNLIQGTYTFRWTVSGPCVNGTDDVVITVPAATQSVTSVSASYVSFCQNIATTAILEGTSPEYANETVTWTQTGGPAATIVNPNSSHTTITGLDGSSGYSFTYTLTNTLTGCSSSANGGIYYTNVAPTMAVGADVIGTCNQTNFSVGFTANGGQTRKYTIISGPTGVGTTVDLGGNSGAQTATANLFTAGTYVLRFENFSYGLSCGSAFDDVQITVSTTPSASNAGTTQNLGCGILSSALAGNTPATGIGRWSQLSGPNTATISTPNSPSSNISGLVAGTYMFNWIISNGVGCVDKFSTAIVRVATPLAPTNAGADQTVCAASTIKLSATAPVSSATGAWSVSPSGPTIATINDAKSLVTNLSASTVYTFTWTVTNTCGSVTDNVLVTVGSGAGPTPANAGTDQCLASGTTAATLAANSITSGTGTWAVVSGPNAPTFTNVNSPTSQVTGLVTGNYILTWNSTVASCQTTTDTVQVTINSSTTVANAGTNQTVCGTTITLAGNVPAVGVGTWMQTKGPGGATITSPNSVTSTVIGAIDGTYAFAWVITNGACTTTTDTVAIEKNALPTIANAGADQLSVCNTTSITLVGNTPTVGTGYWSVVGSATNSPSIISVNSASTSVTNLTTGAYTFRWTILNSPTCPPSFDDVLVQLSAPTNAGSDLNYCSRFGVQLIGTDGSTGTWSQVSPVAPVSTITANTNYTATATLIPGNNYVFQYTANAIFGCPSTSDQITIFDSQFATTPNAGPDQDICLTSGSSIMLAGNTPGLGSGTWSLEPISPAGSTITAPTTPNTTVTGLVQGLYIFNWNIGNANCGTFKDVLRVNAYNAPTVAAAGADNANACPTNFKLAGNQPINGLGTWTQISGPNTSTIEFPNQPLSSISNIIPGTYVYRWTIANGPVCTPSTDDVSITFSTLAPTTPNAGINQGLCNLASFNLAGNTITAGIGTWTIIAGSPAGTITSANSEISSVTSITTGIYNFLWTAVNGGCTVIDTVTITNSALPTTANAGIDKTLCPTELLTLVGNKPTSGKGEWKLVTGPTTPIIVAKDSSTTAVAGTSAGVYTFEWVITSGNCTPSSDAIQVTIAPNCVPTIVNEIITTNEDVPYIVSAPTAGGILNNGDTDPGILTVASIVDNPSNGTFVYNNDGTFTYSPNLNFNGKDTAVVSVCNDGSPILCANDTVFITVNPINDAIVVVNESVSTPLNTSITSTILNGDSDPEGTVITINTTLLVAPTNGTISILPSGAFTYIPNTGFVGKDVVVVSICDSDPIPICVNDTIFISVMSDNDKDGIADANDLDDDNDGIVDTDEACFGAGCGAIMGNPAADIDNDGTPNYKDADFCTLNAKGVCTLLDFDGDGIINQFDIDADNDGITDVKESGASDPDNDGVVGTGPYNATTNDTNNNGVIDSVDPAIVGSTPVVPINTDANGLANFVDIDADNDGIVDNIEGQTTASYIAPLGVDANNNGLDDAYETLGVVGIIPTNTDGADAPDYIDLDTDNDGDNDLLEGWDTDNNGTANITPSGTDADNDGLDDAFDANTALINPTNGQVPTSFPNLDNTTGDRDWREANDSDGDGVSNIIDLDDDNDGILDTVEGTGDFDNDGVLNSLDLDSDNDGITDIYESNLTLAQVNMLDANHDGVVDGPTGTNGLPNAVETISNSGVSVVTMDDSDKDSQPDYLDLDADNDGIFDVTESGHASLDTNNDGIVDGTDTDNDGIINNPAIDSNTTFGGTNQTNPDADNDGSPNTEDLDADNDGIFDITENGTASLDTDKNGVVDGTDTDGDGIINAPTLDANATIGGINNPAANADSDVAANYLDLDADNDGILDIRENYFVGLATIDANNDGMFDGVDIDADGIIDNSIIDANTTGIGSFGGTNTVPVNRDGVLASGVTVIDNVPNYLDIDIDNDGIVDNIEAQPTIGYIAPTFTDSDNDGLDDAYDNFVGFGGQGLTNLSNVDGGSSPDYADADSDNDGINDQTEGPGMAATAGDADGDGLLDIYDVNDALANPTNGLVNTTPAGQTPQSFPNTATPLIPQRDWREALDSDSDGITNINDLDNDNDGILDTAEGAGDTDGDGLLDIFDLDSDNDGMPDLYEAGLTPAQLAVLDPNGDGVVGDPSNLTTYDTNGIALVAETAPNSGISLVTPVDTDADGVPNYQDLDSDNDGIFDVTEAGFAANDIDKDGKLDGTDVDADGIIDNPFTDNPATIKGSTPFVQLDTDNDGIPNYLDLDSDNDGITDVAEQGFVDADGNGIIDNFVDADGDGIADNVDKNQDAITAGSSPIIALDTDMDGIPNYLDLDSDNDGVLDIVEVGGTDANNDGRVDDLPVNFTNGLGNSVNPSVSTPGTPQFITGTDTNNDGTPNTYTTDNQDGMGNPNFLDIDADDDGIVDNIEAQLTIGYIAPSTIDTNKNGLDDAYEAGGVLGINPINTDGTDNQDYLDLDSDNDTFVDAIEGWDTDNDGVANITPVGADADKDGLDDAFDLQVLTAGTVYTNGANTQVPTNFPNLDNGFKANEQDWRDVFNYPVIANADVATTTEDIPVIISVLTNDTDNGAVVSGTTTTITTAPKYGTVVVNVNGSITYTPTINYNGNDTLVYNLCDSGVAPLCDTAIVYITITPVNDPPVTSPIAITVAAGMAVPINVAAGSNDPDGQPLTYSYGNPTGVPVIVTVTGSGAIVVTPVNATDTGLVVVLVISFTATGGNGLANVTDGTK